MLLDVSEGSAGQQRHLLEFLPVDAVLVFVVQLVQALEHVDGVSYRLLVGQIFFDGGEHLLPREQLVTIGVVLLEHVQQFLLELLRVGVLWGAEGGQCQ